MVLSSEFSCNGLLRKPVKDVVNSLCRAKQSQKSLQSESEIKHNLLVVLGSFHPQGHPQQKKQLLAIPVPVPKLPAVRPGKTARLCSTAPCWTPGILIIKKTIKWEPKWIYIYIHEHIYVYTNCIDIDICIYIY